MDGPKAQKRSNANELPTKSLAGVAHDLSAALVSLVRGGGPMIDLRTTCICPPIPTRNFDWSAYDYNTLDGDWDGEKYISPKNHFVGYGTTEEEAIIAWVRILLDDADISLEQIGPSEGAR